MGTRTNLTLKERKKEKSDSDVSSSFLSSWILIGGGDGTESHDLLPTGRGRRRKLAAGGGRGRDEGEARSRSNLVCG